MNEAQFWSRVTRGEGCWEWQGYRNRRGYGQLGVGGKRRKYAHRLALEMALGRELRPGHMACHHCDNPPCVRPDHLYEGTAKTNSADMYERDRQATQLGKARPDVAARHLRAAIERGFVLVDAVDWEWWQAREADAAAAEVRRYVERVQRGDIDARCLWLDPVVSFVPGNFAELVLDASEAQGDAA